MPSRLDRERILRDLMSRTPTQDTSSREAMRFSRSRSGELTSPNVSGVPAAKGVASE
jgi:hypothetical protein